MSLGMKIFNLLLIITSVIRFREADSFVVTKFHTDTIINYFDHVRKSKAANESVEAFFKENLTHYCHILRQSDTFESTPIIMDPYEITPTDHHISESLFEIEQKQGEQQIRKFRLKNKNQTLIFHSFQCLTLEKELKWFITPAFIPDSAFLFEVEPNFRHVVSKETISKVHDEIPARLIAIIDKSGERSTLSLLDGLDALSGPENSYTTQRDPLCDLNLILQRRICVIVADAAVRSENTPFTTLSVGNITSQTYQDRFSNFYYPPEEHGNSCRAPPRRDNGLVFREMLYCSVHIMGKGGPFYVASNATSHPSVVVKFVQGPNRWVAFVTLLKIPILEHLDKYNAVLGKSDM